MTLYPSSERTAGSHPVRAETHNAGARRPLLKTHSLVGLLVLLGLCGCAPDGAGAQEPGPPGVAAGATSPVESIQALLDAYQPVPLEATSDRHDAALLRQREVMAELRRGGRELGLAALAAFRARPDERDEVRSALLEVAAVCDPEGCAAVLERMVTTYDAELGLGLRTRAAELLAQTSPERALGLLTPLVTGAEPDVTLPPREALVRAWAVARRLAGGEDLGTLVDVVVDIAQPPDVRYAAIAELGSFGGDVARQALEEVLFEQSSDAYLRRKAAQALESFLPASQLCPILERAGSHEHDELFAQFLSSMMARNCP